MITVLYVDDDSGLLDLGKLFLERIGNFTVETCPSATDALERLNRTTYNAILSDYEMPVMDGIQFLQEVRTRYPSLPFIIFTGRGREDVVVAALNEGADFYLQKGGEPKAQYTELSHKIRVAVERRKSQDQIRHLARLYQVLSKTNEATVGIRNLPDLVSESCRIAVRDGGFRMAWIGLLHNTGTPGEVFEPVAYCSSQGNTLESPVEPGIELPVDGYPTNIALQEGRFHICADNRIDSDTAPWRDILLRHGYRSSAAFPLRINDSVIGVMTFHAEEPNFFSEEEVQLLIKLTDDISFALEMIAREQNVTELTQLSEALGLANRKLNLLNNIIRHDILNTLAGLLGLEDMALDSTRDPVITDLLQDIQKSTRKIQQQINFTKEYQDIGTAAPVWQNIRNVLLRADYHPANLIVEIPEHLGNLEIYADPLLEKVFYNLIENAVRHAGNLTRIRFLAERTPDGITLICEDDGNGVPNDDKEQIFEPGFGKNTGQGLALAREILAITGITIRETGILHQGARFEIKIGDQAYRIIGSARIPERSFCHRSPEISGLNHSESIGETPR